MGLKDTARRVRSILPVSSRSFHAFEDHVNHSLAELVQAKDILSSVNRSCDEAREALSALSKEHLYEQERDMVLYWHLLNTVRGGGASNLVDTKLEFFRSLPRPDGVQGLFQDNLSKLLEEFDAFCRSNELTYFAGSGTLLGAYLYHDMIPWDDDLDVFVLRPELHRFRDAASKSGRFRITERWDRRCACLQIRFRLADESNPAFVDLFPLDMVSTDDATAVWRRYLEVREEFVSRFFALVNSESFSNADWPYVTPESEHGRMIHALYEDCLGLYGGDVSFVEESVDANSVIRGIDNISESRTTGPWPVSDWLPASNMKFRTFDLMIPQGWQKYLERHYGDYFILPRDMHTHGHVSHQLFEQDSTVQAMRAYLDL